MQGGKRHVAGLPVLVAGEVIEYRLCCHRRAAQGRRSFLRVREDRLEELTDDPERELLLELPTAREKHSDPGLDG